MTGHRERRGTSFLAQMIALVLFVATPLIALIFGLIWVDLHRQQQGVRERVRQAAVTLAQQIAERNGAQTRLLSLIQKAQVASPELNCAAILGALHTTHAHVAVVVRRSDGLPTCTANRLPGASSATTLPLIGSTGARVGSVSAAIDLQPLLLSAQQVIGPDAVAGVADASGLVFARLPRIDGSAPNRLAAAPRAATAEGYFDMRGADGVMRHYGVASAGGSGILAFTGVSTAKTAEPYLQLMGQATAISVMVIVMVLLVAAYMARRFAQPVRSLSDMASQIATTGVGDAVDPGGPLEIQSLTSSFNAMIAKRYEIERRLVESEERYRTMLETSNEGVWASNAQGITTFINTRFAQMLGRTPEEMVGRPALEFVPLAAMAEALKQQSARREGQAASFEFPLDRADGTRIWTLFSATPIFRAGKYDGAFAMITDITARWEAEQRLLESEQMFRRMIETAGEGIWRLDKEMRVAFANQEVTKLLGYPPEEMIGRPAMDFVAESHLDVARIQHANRRAGRHDKFELCFRRKDGGIVWALVSSTALIDGDEFQGAFTMLTDITARRIAEKRLERSESLLRQAQQAAMIGSYVWNVVNDTIEASDVWAQLYELDPAAGPFASEDVWRRIHQEDLERVQSFMKFVLAGNSRAFNLEFRLVGSGGERWIWARGTVDRNEIGEALSITGTSQDITELRQTKTALEISRQQLRALSDRLIVAHEEERKAIARELHDELGQALTAIKIDLDGLASRITNEADRPLIERARQASLETVRAVQRLSADLRPTALDDLGLSAAIQTEARVFEQRTGIECDVSILHEDLITSSKAKMVIFRVMQEALTNVARHANATRVEVRLRWDGHELHLEVRDDGIGIPPEATRATTSIGIVGMRERLAMIGGTLAIEGVPNRGTIVSATIPPERVDLT